MTGRTTVTAGEERTAVAVDDLKRTQIVMYAGASGDFNPLHTDEPFATGVAGNPTVMAHGMLAMGMVGQVLTDWFGAPNVHRYRARFRSPVWPGDTISVIARIEQLDETDGRHLAQVTMRAMSHDGERTVLSGSATVAVDVAGANEESP